MTRDSDTFDELIGGFIEQAISFVPPTKLDQLCKRWITPSLAAQFEEDEDGLENMLVDAHVYAADLLFSQPSPTGATAFDRMARSIKVNVQEARALLALRESRFVLFSVGESTGEHLYDATRLPSGEALRVFVITREVLPAGVVLVGRLACDKSGVYHQAGLLTPLDEAALAVATGPALPKTQSREKESRWVEAIYGHLVRNGTQSVPGLNDEADMMETEEFLAAAAHPLVPILEAWLELGDEAPDAALISRTRQHADLVCTVTAIVGASPCAERPEAETVFERIALILMETIRDQETMIAPDGAPPLTLDMIGGRIEEAIGEGDAPAAVLDTFIALRRRLPAAGVSPDGGPCSA